MKFVLKGEFKIPGLLLFIFTILRTGYCQPLLQNQNLTADDRFVAWAFDDGRPSDFNWVAPMFHSYGAHATFNIINVSEHTWPDYV